MSKFEYTEEMVAEMHEAAEAGVIVPVNYKNSSQKYCGIDIDYSPVFDPSLASY